MTRVGVMLAVAVAMLLSGRPAWAQQQITISIPVGVSFPVDDVSVTTSGSPAPFHVAITNTNVRSSDQVFVSVKAETATFTGPGSTQIPSSKVSWTVGAAANGSGSPGTLSSAAYAQVFASQKNPKTASFDMAWSLAPIAAAGLRAGTHVLSVRWRIEAF